MSASPDDPRVSGAAVEVVCLEGDEPLVAEGRVHRVADGCYILDLDRPVDAIRPGARTILNFPGSDAPRVIARAVSAVGNRLRCEQVEERERERRAWPRLVAGIPLRYRVLRGAETVVEVDAWLKGSDAPRERGAWHEPDPLMNFSVAGLRFDTRGPGEVGDVLLLEFQVGADPRRHRATGRVRHVGEADEDGLRSVAVSFEQIAPEAENALTELTLTIQDALL